MEKSARAKPEAGLSALRQWLARHKLAGLIDLRLDRPTIVDTLHREAETRTLELAGCYVIVTNVDAGKLTGEQVHESYMPLQKVERDFGTMKTGLFEMRPVFVRKESRTRGHVCCCLFALKLVCELVMSGFASARCKSVQRPLACPTRDCDSTDDRIWSQVWIGILRRKRALPSHFSKRVDVFRLPRIRRPERGGKWHSTCWLKAQHALDHTLVSLHQEWRELADTKYFPEEPHR